MPKTSVTSRLSGKHQKLLLVSLQTLIISGLLVELVLLATWSRTRTAFARALTVQPETFTELSFVSVVGIKSPPTGKTADIPYRVTNQTDSAKTYQVEINIQDGAAVPIKRLQTFTLAAHQTKTFQASVASTAIKPSITKLSISLAGLHQTITYNLPS